jgi:hypothetical protein
MIKYIVESASVAQKRNRDYEIFGRITVKLNDYLPDNVSIKSVIKAIEDRIPEHVLYDVDAIYVGNCAPLEDRQVDSIYVSGSILVKPEHASNKDLFNTLVHEFAHAVEETAKDFIYGDGDVGSEFLNKRNRLYNMLKDDYKISKKQFLNINFDQAIDDFFSKEIGYSNLDLLTNGLFLSPYAATSLREYFANGFEHFYIEGPDTVKQISPAVFHKVRGIIRGDHL